ncbi:MAG TPA: TonB-dependent receptor [Gemmatimonadales bacterium]|jgi:iron complex outermembrane receptor protein|nr:TonB-dependent receptor [Gemmatimonadales bacterium]
MRLLLSLLCVPSLAAQVPDTTVRDTVPLPPVTVTATRHATSLMAAPLAVTQIKKRDLFGTAGYGLDDALSLVPGVVVQSRYGNQDVRIAIRGYGARGAGDRSNAGTARGIRVLLDGFPETEPDGRTSFDGIDLAAAQSIEVIRSNASAVWGNAAGGVVSVSTVPEFDDRLGAVEPTVGSFGLQRWALRSGVRLGVGKLAASFVRSDFAGWREHSASERSLLNVALVTPLTEHTDLGVYAVGSHNVFRIPGPLTAAQVAADPRQANATYLGRDERRDNLVGRLGLTVNHRVSERVDLAAMAFVNPKVLHRSERGTFRDFTRYHVGGNTVVRLGGLIVGADFAAQDGAILFYSLTSQGTRGDTLRDDKREGARNAGVFVTEEVTRGRWTMALGARYDNITYDYQNFLDPSIDARKAFTGITPKVGVTYRLGPLHSVYASLGGGVEAPAGNETDPASTFGQDTVTAINPLLDPIRSITYEAGTKRILAFGDGWIRDLSYDVALYQTAVTDEIVPYRGGRFYFTAGKVRRRGAELGLRARMANGLSLQTALAFADHRYTVYVVDSVHYGAPGAFADYGGNRVVGVPNLTYAVAVALAPPAWRPLRLRVGVQGMSSYFADDANQVRVPAYRIATATVGTDEPLKISGGLGVTGFVTVVNLFDQQYIGSAFLNPDVVAGEAVAFEPGLPRHVIVGVTLTTR